ncbi:peptidylprolyl isomerase [Chenggangzhangella methanolivorans]|uniref:Parvulin-like PPIase n=1 Tax=Chenggangzhangella methanolivorans TaxID=1437009 RepID=A0A9E6RIE0_9HYPH|nr:peptidylprolyl isomerase [Chenggangzhangella methanolivorans]QZO01567.1 peptidylprolyl isomerase [Chenggangzhangella methanolivorans]
MAIYDLKNSRPLSLGIAIVAGLGLSSAAFAQTPPPAAAAAEAPAKPEAKLDPSTVLARIDGAEITAGDVEVASEDLQQSMSSMSEDQRRDYALNYLIDLKLAAKKAEADKLGDSPEFKKRVAYLQERALMEELLQKEAKAAVTEDRLRKLYDDTAKNLKPEEEVRARHILVKTEDEAKKVEERLAKGEDFAKIANDVSTDPGSGKQGGDLGFFGRGQMVPAFEEAAFKLEPGKVSAPIKTQFGFHVIKLEEKRTRPVPPFEQVRPQIENYVVRTAQQDLVLKLRQDAKVERTEAGKPSAPPVPLPGAEAPAGGATSAPPQ